MIVFIIADMEGASGIYRRGQCHYGRDLWRTSGRHALTATVNALAQGAFQAGAARVYYRDIHDTGLNTDLALLDKRIIATVGQFLKPIPILGEVPRCDLIFFVGHASVAKPAGFIPHTMHGHVTELTVNGRDASEIELFAAVTTAPFALAVGDKVMVDEAAAAMPWLETVTIDKNPQLLEDAALRTTTLENERVLLQKAAQTAIDQAATMKPYSIQEPVTIRVKVRADSPLAANAYHLPLDNGAFVIEAKTYLEAYAGLVRLLFFPPSILAFADPILALKRWWYRHISSRFI